MDHSFLTRLGRMRPLYLTADGAVLVARGDRLLLLDPESGRLTPMARLNQALIMRLAARIGVLRRLLRIGMHELVALPDGALLGSVRGALVRLDPGADRFLPVFPVPRGSRPLRLCVTPEGHIYFGDYFQNPAREAVRLWGSRDGGRTWETVHTFAPGEVRHVHGVFYDAFRKGCWVLTGDSDSESRMLFTSDHFQTLRQVAGGSQAARSVALLPFAAGLITASDTPHEQNYIHWLDPGDGSLTRLQDVPSSVFYGAEAGDYKLLSTTVEPSPVNTGNAATLWFSRDGRKWKQLTAWRRDFLAGRFFQYATFHFPRGRNPRNIAYTYGQALHGADGHLLRWDLDAAWQALP